MGSQRPLKSNFSWTRVHLRLEFFILMVSQLTRRLLDEYFGGKIDGFPKFRKPIHSRVDNGYSSRFSKLRLHANTSAFAQFDASWRVDDAHHSFRS